MIKHLPILILIALFVALGVWSLVPSSPNKEDQAPLSYPKQAEASRPLPDSAQPTNTAVIAQPRFSDIHSAPGLLEFANFLQDEGVPTTLNMAKTLAARGEYDLSLLAYERILEKTQDKETQENIQAQISIIKKVASLWQPDPFMRKPLNINLTIFYPTPLALERHKVNLTENLTFYCGGIYSPTVSLKQIIDSSTKILVETLDTHSQFSFHSNDIPKCIEEALFIHFKNKLQLPRRQGSLNTGLSRYEWTLLQR